MKKLWNWVKDNPNRSMFLVPILLVAGISISHVVSWYNIANPFNWAVYLSIAIEVGAMTALVAATNKIKGGVWFMFGIVTLIQMIGNIFFTYKEIDQNGELFKSWVELTGPIWEMVGSDPADIPSMKRWLAFLEGGLLPIISLTSLHFFVKYEGPNSPKESEISPKNEEKPLNTEFFVENDPPKESEISPKTDEEIIEDVNDERIGRLVNLQKEADTVWDKVRELKKKGKLPEQTEEDIDDEPIALANSEYRESLVEEDEDEQPVLVEEENPEDEIIFPITGNTETKNFEESINDQKTLGDELTKTWNRIIKKTNNNIQRID
jgi:hypothetical protein